MFKSKCRISWHSIANLSLPNWTRQIFNIQKSTIFLSNRHINIPNFQSSIFKWLRHNWTSDICMISWNASKTDINFSFHWCIRLSSTDFSPFHASFQEIERQIGKINFNLCNNYLGASKHRPISLLGLPSHKGPSCLFTVGGGENWKDKLGERSHLSHTTSIKREVASFIERNLGRKCLLVIRLLVGLYLSTLSKEMSLSENLSPVFPAIIYFANEGLGWAGEQKVQCLRILYSLCDLLWGLWSSFDLYILWLLQYTSALDIFG